MNLAKNFRDTSIGVFFVFLIWFFYWDIPQRANFLEFQLTSYKYSTTAQIDSLGNQLLTKVDKFNTTLETFGTGINNNLKDTNANLKVVTDGTQAPLKSLASTLDSSTKLADNINKGIDDAKTTWTADSRFDCDVNAYCYQNLVSSTLISTRQMTKDISLATNTLNAAIPENTLAFTKTMKLISDDAVPNIVQNSKDFTKSTAGIAENINRITKPKWYDRAIGYGLNAAALYGRLNPIGITVTAVDSAIKAK